MTIEPADIQLNNIITQINTIYLDAKNSQDLLPKISSHNEAIVLINQARTLIENLENEINEPIKDVSQMTTDELGQLTELMALPCLNFNEVLYIIKRLRAFKNGLPDNAKIIDNIPEEIIYDEQIVDEFK